MSRVGKHEVVIPDAIKLSNDSGSLNFSYKNLSAQYLIPECINYAKTEKGFILTPKDNSQRTRSLWGTTQRNLSNIIKGFDKGFSLNIELIGVGYRAAVDSGKLVLQLGYSHEIVYSIPEGITIKCEKPTSIVITGSNKQLVGTVGAELKKYRKPEPYKGKGVIRQNEYVVRKEGKKK